MRYLLTGPKGVKVEFLERPDRDAYKDKYPPNSGLTFEAFDRVDKPGSEYSWYCMGDWTLKNASPVPRPRP